MFKSLNEGVKCGSQCNLFSSIKFTLRRVYFLSISIILIFGEEKEILIEIFKFTVINLEKSFKKFDKKQRVFDYFLN